MTDVSRRIDSRAKRGLQLQPWGLAQSRAAVGSSLHADDDGFAPELNMKNLVSSTALYPAMAATDALSVASETTLNRRDSHNLHTVATLTLCRSALESAAQTIWMLSPTERDERRARCLALSKYELLQQSYFVGLLDTTIHTGSNRLSNADYSGFISHKEEFEERRKYLNGVAGLKGIQYRVIVADAADWIRANVPPHDNGEIRERDLTHGMKVAYNLGSSAGHGMKWIRDYLGDERNIMSMTADCLAAAVNMTECAIALYEAQANIPRSHIRNAKCPNRLHQTVAKWARMYPPPERDETQQA
ncbi:hypothetical protein ABW18_00100 [Gordonia jacobaea]|uniref:Uncharacterized protein n=1 Tax=Gordonia jacobaea TaxID=122202 RepID=A0ABR5II44_9ACTN|nr:hypothetical protein ABW18_00100 [Gordonia jacobaea]